MSPDEYALDIKTKFGSTTTSDGRMIRDLDDRELVKRMLTRYPGDKSKIQGVEEYLAGDMPPMPPKTPQQEKTEQTYQNVLQKFGAGVSTRFQERSQNVAEHAGATERGEQGVASGIFQSMGETAGFIGDIGFEGIKALLPDDLKEGIKGAIQGVASTEAAQGLAERYSQWKSENPELAENVEAGFNIATVIPGAGFGAKAVGKAGEVAVEAAETVAKNAPRVAQDVSTATRGAITPVAERLTPNLEKEAMDIAVIGPQGKKSTVSALERSGRPGGYAPDDSFVGKIVGADKYVPTKRDIEVAEAVRGVVRKSNTPAKNIANINDKISEVSETVVRPILKANPSPFNVATYAKKLNDVEIPDFIRSDAVLENTYNMVRNRFIEVVRKGVKNKEGLWEARKDIDDIIEQQFGAAGFNPDKYSALQKAMLDMRRATNDFIAEGIPDNAFKTEMQRLSRMYEAKHNIALDNYAIQNKDAIIKWMANNPRKATALKLTIGAGALTGGATLLFGD